MANGPLYQLCHSCPWVKFGHAPGVNSLHRLTMGKHSNINISKASWQILIKLHPQRHWAVEKVAYCFFGQIGLEPWQHTYFNRKKKKKIFFSETTGPTTLIFGMWQWLMVLYINYVLGFKAPYVCFHIFS